MIFVEFVAQTTYQKQSGESSEGLANIANDLQNFIEKHSL